MHSITVIGSITSCHYWLFLASNTCLKFVKEFVTYTNSNVLEETSFFLQKWKWAVIPCLLFH
jgi:hypothetical protein